MLFCVELHGGVGLYRLVVKWGWFEGADPNRTRRRLTQLKWGLTVFFLALVWIVVLDMVRSTMAHLSGRDARGCHEAPYQRTQLA